MMMNDKIPGLLKKNQDKVTISVEILPPIRGQGLKTIFDNIEQIRSAKPLWIDVTSHTSDIEWIPSGDDEVTFKKNKRRKSPGTIAICAAIKYHFDIVTVPHLLCAGFSREETEDALIDLNYLGIHNVLAITGDDHEKANKQTLYGNNQNSFELTKQILEMNQGQYLDQTAKKTQFCVGVGCYPEKHYHAPNLQYSDSIFLEKQALGACYGISQMFYNNEKFYQFLDRLKHKVHIPIIPAMKILTSKKQLFTLPKFFYIDIPEQLVERMGQANTKAEEIETGVEWTFQQCQSLIEQGHNHLHFYIMRNTQPFMSLMEKLDKCYSL